MSNTVIREQLNEINTVAGQLLEQHSDLLLSTQIIDAVLEPDETPNLEPIARITPLAGIPTQVGHAGHFSSVASSDPEGSALTVDWSVSVNGVVFLHSVEEEIRFAVSEDGLYLITLTVADDQGLIDTATLDFEVAGQVEPPQQGQYAPTHMDPWIPRYSHAAYDSMGSLLYVDTDTTVNLDLAYERIVIGNGGRLYFPPHQSREISATVIQVLPGGIFQIGDEDDPATAEINVRINDRAIDIALDPGTYGTGIIIHPGAKFKVYSEYVTPYVQLTKEPQAGDRTLSFDPAAMPVNWRPADELVLHSTEKQPLWSTFMVAQGYTADGVDLVDPLPITFYGAYMWDDNLIPVLYDLPEVANTERRVTISSPENAVTRGHMMFVGSGDVTIRNAAILNMTRTTNRRPRDETVFTEEGHVALKRNGKGELVLDEDGNVIPLLATNQKSRYAVHFHHCYGPPNLPTDVPQWEVTGCYIDAGDFTKHLARWGVAIHGSHYGDFSNNVVLRFHGANIVTEDGTESENRIQHNLSFSSNGAGGTENKGGGAGTGIWLRGPDNYVDYNRIGTNRKNGIDIFQQNYPKLPQGYWKPAFKGGNPHNPDERVPAKPRDPLKSFRGNKIWGNLRAINGWVVSPGEIRDLRVYNPQRDKGIGFFGYGTGRRLSDGTILGITLVDPVLLGHVRQTSALEKPLRKPHYFFPQAAIGDIRNSLGFTVINPIVHGWGIAIGTPGQNKTTYTVRGGDIRCQIGIRYNDVVRRDNGSKPLVIDGTRFGDMPFHTGWYVTYEWVEPTKFKNGVVYYAEFGPVHLLNWQGTGKDYQLYMDEQAADYVIPEPSENAGLTNAEAPEGQAIGGSIMPDGTVELDVVRGRALELPSR